MTKEEFSNLKVGDLLSISALTGKARYAEVIKEDSELSIWSALAYEPPLLISYISLEDGLQIKDKSRSDIIFRRDAYFYTKITEEELVKVCQKQILENNKQQTGNRLERVLND